MGGARGRSRGPGGSGTRLFFRLAERAVIDTLYGTYVSDRPDLTNPVGRASEQEVFAYIEPYFAHNGLATAGVRNLRVAAVFHRKFTALIRFSASEEQLRTLVEGKTQLPTGKVLWELSHSQCLTSLPELEALEEEAWDFSFLGWYPFGRLTWWPPPRRARGRLETYRGAVDWDQRGKVHGQVYLIFLDPATGDVWLWPW